MIKILVAFLTSFVLGLLLMPILINLLSKKKSRQTILGYVENHKDKNGTLTMGGIVFIICLLLVPIVLLDFDYMWLMVVLVSVAFGILGYMDDHLKIKYSQNLGLRPYQKIIGQLGISIIFALFVYFTQGGKIFLLFTENYIDIGFWIIPFIILVMIAVTNSVNLTDGLDGLAGNVSMFYLIFFTVILSILGTSLYSLGETGQVLTNINNMQVLSMVVVGSVLAFLQFNTNKAKIFMGDVGSLCLGGFIGASAVAVGQELIILILGFCFVFSALSVILQVAVFKLKKKRIFKMAPFHHHLQMSGLSEAKIVMIYSTITAILGVLCIIFYLI